MLLVGAPRLIRLQRYRTRIPGIEERKKTHIDGYSTHKRETRNRELQGATPCFEARTKQHMPRKANGNDGNGGNDDDNNNEQALTRESQ